jgi:chemotaxis protein MotB
VSDLGSITEDLLSHAEENEEDLWVVSYADMVTLLFGFFVILYSFSTLDEKKFAEMAESVAQSFKDDKMPQKELDDVVIRDKKARAFDQLVAILNIAKTPQEALEKIEDKAHYRNQHLLVQGVMEQFVRDNGQELSQVFKPFVSQDAFSEIIIPAVWLFEKGRSEILPLADEKLQSLAQKIRLLPDVVEIDIVGHTDSSLPPRGTPFKDNLTLSSMRAGVVAASFIRYGIPPHMISIRGMGDLRPLVPERDDDGHFIPENQAKNRRVHIVLKKKVTSHGP